MARATWNEANLFTGLVRRRPHRAGSGRGDPRWGAAGRRREVLPDTVHTSLQTRAIRTAQLALDAMDRLWIPVRRHWRLNERHYGALQGLDKKETADKHGDDQLKIWRRSYSHAPATGGGRQRAPSRPTTPATPTCRPRCCRPRSAWPTCSTACCPYWHDGIVPDLAAGRTVLVAAHGNSLRALVKHLDGIGDDDISELNIPTGIPLVYDLDDAFRPAEAKPVEDRYLGGADAAKAAADAVAKQAG